MNTDEAVGRLAEKIDALHEDVREVKQQTTKTNGSVRELQVWRASVDTLLRVDEASHGAYRTLTIGIACAAVGGLLDQIAQLLTH